MQYVIKTKNGGYVESFNTKTGECNSVESIFDATKYNLKIAYNIAYRIHGDYFNETKMIEEFNFNHDARTCFGLSTEKYIGSWFGHDVYQYSELAKNWLLATTGNEGGDYSTLIWDKKALFGKIGSCDGFSQPMADYMTTNSVQKAYLMGAMAIFLDK